MINILLTGGTGFIGKNFVERIENDNNFHVYGLVHEPTDILYFQKHNISAICEQEFNSFDKPIDICIHLASYGVRYTDRNIDTMIDVNVKLSAKVFTFAAEHKCKYFFNVGSCFEYGSTNAKKPIEETTPLNPEDIYAGTKVACETILSVLSTKYSTRLITLRPFSIYGKYEPEWRLYPLIIKAGMTNTPLDLTNGDQIRDYMNVCDVADAIYQIIFNRETIPNDVKAINICSGCGVSLKNFILKIIEDNCFNIELYKFGAKEQRKNESKYFVGDNNLLKKIIKREY